MKMLDGVADLTLELLNEATQAWVEIEYHRAVHRETSCSPVEPSPRPPMSSARVLRANHCATRFAWKPSEVSVGSDGTISLEGVRFEIPARYRHFREVTVRYGRWDLGRSSWLPQGVIALVPRIMLLFCG